MIQPLPAWIHPLSDVNASISDEELSSIDSIVANARIVGLGEPTHGQKEINQLRDRLTRYLVGHHGFRVVAIEDSVITCRCVNDYIQRGIGSACEALSAQPFWHWRTHEYLEMIEWLRTWNIHHPDDQVHLIGIDIQNLTASVQHLQHALAETLSSHPELEHALETIASIQIWASVPETTSTINYLLAATEHLTGLVENEDEHQLDSIQAIREGLTLWQTVITSDPESGESWAERDRNMAARALAPIAQSEKVVVWAHNGHVQADALDGQLVGVKTMGQYLRDQAKSAYIVVAGLFGSGSYRGINLETKQLELLDVGDPPVGSIDHDLWQMSTSPALLVDVRSFEIGSTTTRMAGAALEPSAEMTARVDPRQAWDAAIFVRAASPSTPLRR